MENRSVLNTDGFMVDFPGDDIDSGETVRLVACGDTGPVRSLEAIVLDKGGAYVVNEMLSVLERADIVMANLEVPFSDRGKPLDKVPAFRVPPACFELVTAARISVASLANNHIGDYGIEAFEDTVELLSQHAVTAFGAGLSMEAASRPAIIEKNGLKIGFLGYKDKERGSDNPDQVFIPEYFSENILKAIRDLKKQVDIVVISVHFGWEYQHYPAPRDVQQCRRMIDSGADIVLGHHPHFPQGLEKYSNGLIAYSLGNFIWDQNFSGFTDSSFVLDVGLTRRGISSARIHPFLMEKTYRIKLSDEKLDIKKMNQFASVFQGQKEINRKWYFICRNKVFEILKNYFYKLSKQDIAKANKYFWDFLRNDRMNYTLRSFLGFLLRAEAPLLEIKNKISKQTSFRSKFWH